MAACLCIELWRTNTRVTCADRCEGTEVTMKKWRGRKSEFVAIAGRYVFSSGD
jgi:hypothetical protein